MILMFRMSEDLSWCFGRLMSRGDVFYDSVQPMVRFAARVEESSQWENVRDETWAKNVELTQLLNFTDIDIPESKNIDPLTFADPKS